MIDHHAGSATSFDLAALEQLARAATPGPWYKREHWSGSGAFEVCSDPIGIALAELTNWATDEIAYDAAFIAAANPATVLELIALARATPQHPDVASDDPSEESVQRLTAYALEAIKEADQRTLREKFDAAFLSWNGFHTKAELDQEWAPGTLAGEMFRAGAAERRATPQHSVTFPERDQSKPAEQQGLFRKFDVRRVDGSDQPGGKHYGCRYYVLDLTHDQHAPAAMRAYAAACASTHPQLAADIVAEFCAQHSVTEQAKGPTIDLDYLALDAIRKSYVSAFGPLDPNITANDIDWHIQEIIKEAARAQPLASTAATQPEQALDEAEIDRLARKHNLDGSMIVGHRHDYWRAFAADVIRAALAIPASKSPSESTGIKDKTGKYICVGDTVESEDGYSLVIHKNKQGNFFGKLVCEPGDSCENIPYSLKVNLTIVSTAASKQQAGALNDPKMAAYLRNEPWISAYIETLECDLQKAQAALTHRATTAACGTCDGNGVIGFPPDQYEHCPDCAAAPDIATTAATDEHGLTVADWGHFYDTVADPDDTDHSDATTAADGSIDGQLTGAPFAVKKATAADQQGDTASTSVIGGQRWSKEAEMTESWLAAQSQQGAAQAQAGEVIPEQRNIFAIERHGDQSAIVIFRSCRAASAFITAVRAAMAAPATSNGSGA